MRVPIAHVRERAVLGTTGAGAVGALHSSREMLRELIRRKRGAIARRKRSFQDY
jgi:hypothetical protein